MNNIPGSALLGSLLAQSTEQILNMKYNNVTIKNVMISHNVPDTNVLEMIIQLTACSTLQRLIQDQLTQIQESRMPNATTIKVTGELISLAATCISGTPERIQSLRPNQTFATPTEATASTEGKTRNFSLMVDPNQEPRSTLHTLTADWYLLPPSNAQEVQFLCTSDSFQPDHLCSNNLEVLTIRLTPEANPTLTNVGSEATPALTVITNLGDFTPSPFQGSNMMFTSTSLTL